MNPLILLERIEIKTLYMSEELNEKEIRQAKRDRLKRMRDKTVHKTAEQLTEEARQFLKEHPIDVEKLNKMHEEEDQRKALSI